jgi:hypothetical protein
VAVWTQAQLLVRLIPNVQVRNDLLPILGIPSGKAEEMNAQNDLYTSTLLLRFDFSNPHFLLCEEWNRLCLLPDPFLGLDIGELLSDIWNKK